MIHPPRWRGTGTTNPRLVGEVGRVLREEMDIEWLSIHNISDGSKNFSMATRYDMYVAVKRNTPGHKTEIWDEEGRKFPSPVCIKNQVIIPNLPVDLDLFAKDGADVVDWIPRNQTKFAKDQDERFRFPCVDYTRRDGTLKIMYAETKNHLGTPKVIFNDYNNSGKPYADVKGEYGLVTHSVAIADDVENLPLIAKAMHSERFRYVMRAYNFTTCEWNVNVIRDFRKDFWKEFIDMDGNLIDAEGNIIPEVTS